jgi:glycosyltransferase involved in cell wall biosynthesis
MRILLIMNPGLPVPPRLYGGVERIVYQLAERYHKMGHQVTLLAGPGSYCSGTTITFGSNNSEPSKSKVYKEVYFVWSFLLRHRYQFDLIHNFGRLIYFLPIVTSRINKIISYQRPVTPGGIRIIQKLSPRQLLFTGCSNYCVSSGNVAGKWKTIYNTIDFSAYNLRDNISTDAPYIFLGRLDKIKGAHTAIAAVKANSSKLWLAGNIPDSRDGYNYYKSTIEPQIDNEQIIYLGELDDVQKNHYLGQSKALLFPIEWDEPFGIVMIEAMACGTPVIGFRRGSVPEVVDGHTGRVVENLAGMIEVMSSITELDRKLCRDRAVHRFDISVIAPKYLNAFFE